MSDRQVLLETFLEDEAATVDFGTVLADELLANYGANALVYLHGDLGAGKTTLVRGILRALGHSGVVKSPTYTLLEPYDINGIKVFHFDLYRVNDPQELEFVGVDEIVDGPGIKIFEWPERAQSWLPEPVVEVFLSISGNGSVPGRTAEVRYA